MEFSKRLAALRKECKETQVQLAESVHITSRSLQDLEYGRYYPKFETFLALSDHFGVTLDYLAGRTDER